MSDESGRDDPDGTPLDRIDEPPDLDDLLDTLEELETTVDSGAERRRVREAIRVARRVPEGGTFGRVIEGFDRADLAEALVGSVVFGIPMLIEGGTLEVGDYVADHGVLAVAGLSIPVYYLGTLAFGVAMVNGILYVADFQDVRIHRPILGVVPRRVVGVLGVSALTAALLMTAWGRVDWADPWVAVSRITVAFVGMAIGAALGDILPGN